MLCFNNRD